MYDNIPQCINFTTLSHKQQKAVDIILKHYHSNEVENPLFMIIQGTMGIGKSYLIGAINQSLQMASMTNPSPLLLLAPTGVATFNIGASTIHSKLWIPITYFSQLQWTRLTCFQQEMENVKYILIDEMSFIGQNMLENIDGQLRKSFPHKVDISFGGIPFLTTHDVTNV